MRLLAWLMLPAVMAALGLPLAKPAFAGDGGSVLVRTAPARRGTLPDTVSAFGTAGPASNGVVTIALPVEGSVLGLDVTAGESVRAGDRLLVFGPSAAAASRYRQAETALGFAQGQRARVAQQLAQQLATRDQLAGADRTVRDARTALDALGREGDGTPRQVLTAPFDGIVLTVPVAQGDRIQPGAALLTLTRLDRLMVTVGIEPAERVRVRPGQAALLTPLAGGAPVTGRVLRIDGMLNPRTREVDADIAVPAGSVLSGEAFTARVAVGAWSGWVVPHDSVLLEEGGGVLFQVRAGKAVRIAVRVLGSAGADDVVEGRLDPASPVVVEGNYQLGDGAAVREQAAPGGEAGE